MKPLGVAFRMDESGPRLLVTKSDRATDSIWEAVREAINATMTPEQFKLEAADAWQYHLKEDAEYARKVLVKG